MAHRTFIAIDLEEGVKSLLHAWARTVEARVTGLRVPSPENLHLTLKFLGEVSEAQVGELGEALASLAKNISVFDLRGSGFSLFPSQGPARVLWTGVLEPERQLLPLVEKIESRCLEMGFKREGRPFRPHITLGRIKNPEAGDHVRSYIEDNPSPQKTWTQTVRDVRLKKSTLSRSGPDYKDLIVAPLQIG